MVRKSSRGQGTRAAVVTAIAEKPGITEEEIVKSVGKSKGTVRNVLGVLREKSLVATKRAPSRGRGPGPLLYRLNLRGRRTVQNVVQELEQEHGAPGVRRSARNVYVFVRKGTNETALTKDGRILRVAASAVKEHEAAARKQLGKQATPVTLAEFLRTFYPEGKIEL